MAGKVTTMHEGTPLVRGRRGEEAGLPSPEASPSSVRIAMHDLKKRSEVAHSLALRSMEIESSTSSSSGSSSSLSPTSTRAQARTAIRASLVMNLILAFAKTYAAVASGSLAVLSSLVDSILDLVSQWLFWYSDKHIHTPSTKYPAGRQRLEPIAVIIMATLMGMAAIEVVQKSVETLLLGLKGTLPVLDVSTITLGVLALVVLVKIALWVYCARIGKDSPSASALAQDHRNDVFSNAIAIATCVIAHHNSELWYTDSLGAIAISIYIAFSWLITGKDQVERLVGLEASPEFLADVRALAREHHPLMDLDTVRAYHFGNNYIVELEVILPPTMCVRDAHDISLALQRTVESKRCVERAFVHVDYCPRSYDEHKDPTKRPDEDDEDDE